jgi:hypothetical protein
MSPGCLAIAGESMDEDDASGAKVWLDQWTDSVTRGIILHTCLVGLGEGSEAIATPQLSTALPSAFFSQVLTTFNLGKCKWEAGSSCRVVPAGALAESYVWLSIPQPHSLTEQLLQALGRKNTSTNPHSKLRLPLDPDVCPPNNELSSSSSLRNGAHALI